MKLLCQFSVGDYARWRSVFDAQAFDQHTNGLILLNLWQEAGRAENVFVLFDVTDEELAREFVAGLDGAAQYAEAGIQVQHFHFLESGRPAAS
jgi:hypothetical protein